MPHRGSGPRHRSPLPQQHRHGDARPVNGGPASGIYKPGDEINLADFGGGKLTVSEIFG